MIEEKNELVRILEIGMGNCAQRALCVALKKKLFLRLSGRKASLPEMAEILECSERPARIIADVLVALRLLVSENGHFSPTTASEVYLSPGKESYIGDFLLMLDERLYGSWSRLEETVKNNVPQKAFPDVGTLTPEEIQNMVQRAIMGLHGLTTITSSALADIITLAPGSTHLDLGGGTGALCITLARRFPEVHFTIIDQGPVLQVTGENVEKANLRSRIELIQGDFFKDPYPEGISSISLSNVLQDWSKENRMKLIYRSYHALPPGGMLIIMECMFDEEHHGPLLSALMSLNMLIETAGGENYSAGETEHMLRIAGFSRVETFNQARPFVIMRAYK